MDGHADYVVSVDLGQANDYTAIAVLEVPLWVAPGWESEAFTDRPGWLSPERFASVEHRDHVRGLSYRRGRPGKPPLRLRHLERVRGVSYQVVADRVAELMRSPPLPGAFTSLVVDYTGVGRAVFDLMVVAGLQPVTVTLTGGNEVTSTETGWNVPKRDLIAAAVVALQNRRLIVAPQLAEASTLERELLAFRVKITSTAHDTYEGRQGGVHDDLVLAVAQGVWLRDWREEHLDRVMEIPQAVAAR